MPGPRPNLIAVVASLALLAPGCGNSDDQAQQSSTVEIDDTTRSEAQQLIGRHIEDGIAWAEDRGIDWRLTVIGGREVDNDSPERDNRISFQTDVDVIVVVEWS